MSARTARFSSRFALLASMLGIAIGTANIWRFPRIAAQNGGDKGAGAFLVTWVVCLVTWSVPLIVAEYALGRVGRPGIVGAFAAVAGRRFAWMGAFVGLVATAIMFYYSVVAGWCLYYLAHSVTSQLPAHTGEAKAVWDELQGGYAPVYCHLPRAVGPGTRTVRGCRPGAGPTPSGQRLVR
jgi:NSS family neurotransmitter:Na+ symporter